MSGPWLDWHRGCHFERQGGFDAAMWFVNTRQISFYISMTHSVSLSRLIGSFSVIRSSTHGFEFVDDRKLYVCQVQNVFSGLANGISLTDLRSQRPKVVSFLHRNRRKLS